MIFLFLIGLAIVGFGVALKKEAIETLGTVIAVGALVYLIVERWPPDK